MREGRVGEQYMAHGPLRFFYRTWLGRVFLRVLISRFVSNGVGWVLNRGISKPKIRSFIKNNNIDMTQFEEVKYRSFNEFFYRRIKDGMRPFSEAPEDLCSPCDSSLSAYRIDDTTRVVVKGSPYTVAELLDDEERAKEYVGGWFLVYRLGVTDYHRYAFFDDAEVISTRNIKGKYHTVQPIAFERFNVYHRNHRVTTHLKTANFGDAMYVEVGALAVGKICNHPDKVQVKRGEEKGYFAFGGSTIVVLLKANTANIDADILANTEEGLETPVKQGEVVGHRIAVSCEEKVPALALADTAE